MSLAASAPGNGSHSVASEVVVSEVHLASKPGVVTSEVAIHSKAHAPAGPVSHGVGGAKSSAFLLSAYQQVPPAPGREPSVSQPAPSAPAGAAPPPSPLGGILPLLIMVVPMVLLLVFSSRSQQKKQAAAIASLKKGDRVLIQGGLVGRLVELTDRYAKLEIAPGVKVEVLKSSVLGADNVETQAAAEKK
ncbi:MAG TPA: preprotein translocase subunit YajC [Polyangiaceae bacterium]|nr:preprotein translocase subunit YajC [Polyangiaceae bacterium]